MLCHLLANESLTTVAVGTREGQALRIRGSGARAHGPGQGAGDTIRSAVRKWSHMWGVIP